MTRIIMNKQVLLFLAESIYETPEDLLLDFLANNFFTLYEVVELLCGAGYEQELSEMLNEEFSKRKPSEETDYYS